MSRSGYEDCKDANPLADGRYRGALGSAIRGKRGQKALREMLIALDGMPVKRLATGYLVTEGGGFCALGVLAAKRGLAVEKIDPSDPHEAAAALGIARVMAREIVGINDMCVYDAEFTNASALRWRIMRGWVADQIKPEAED